jgi:ABC-2 type transport system permease protein
MLLSGFMFPFQWMPSWAQALGEVLPLTHFVRVARAALLKGQDGSIVHEIWPIGFFGLVAAAVALAAYRRRPDRLPP